METLQTLKNNYAQEQGYEDWADLAIHHELKAVCEINTAFYKKIEYR